VARHNIIVGTPAGKAGTLLDRLKKSVDSTTSWVQVRRIVHRSDLFTKATTCNSKLCWLAQSFRLCSQTSMVEDPQPVWNTKEDHYHYPKTTRGKRKSSSLSLIHLRVFSLILLHVRTVDLKIFFEVKPK